MVKKLLTLVLPISSCNPQRIDWIVKLMTWTRLIAILFKYLLRPASSKAVDPGTLDLILESGKERLQAHDMDASDGLSRYLLRPASSLALLASREKLVGKPRNITNTCALLLRNRYRVICLRSSLKEPFRTDKMWETHHDATVYEIMRWCITLRTITLITRR